VRRGARSALCVGLALAAIAVRGARAEVRSINLDDCSVSCVAPMIDDLVAAEDESAAGVTLSLFGGTGADDQSKVHSDLIFDPKVVPTVLVSGLPSPIASVGGLGVSPYDFFADVIDVPHSADARAFAAVSFFFFTPPFTQGALTDVVWASQALFERRSSGVASRLALPLPADAGRQPTEMRTPAPSLSGISGPPSGAGVWDEWSCTWTQPLSDPWKQPASGPC
jgi:hypothetical protein